MKDCFVLYYNPDTTSIEKVYDIFKRFENIETMKGKTLIVLPDAVNLKSYTKDELKELLKIYKEYTEELINE